MGLDVVGFVVSQLQLNAIPLYNVRDYKSSTTLPIYIILAPMMLDRRNRGLCKALFCSQQQLIQGLQNCHQRVIDCRVNQP